MKFPVEIVFRNELLRSGRELPTCHNEEDYAQRAEEYKRKAKSLRRFSVWVAIDSNGRETEIARGEE